MQGILDLSFGNSGRVVTEFEEIEHMEQRCAGVPHSGGWQDRRRWGRRDRAVFAGRVSLMVRSESAAKAAFPTTRGGVAIQANGSIVVVGGR